MGWNDNGGNGYWILRNSWGNKSWGENGYMRIKYTSAAVACEACYLVYSASPQVFSDGAVVAAESCYPTNGAIDPGETVTANFALKNTGGANTTNLVATLQSTGGVTAVSGPQTYGALVAGGSSVAKPFTFTASGACGGAITPTLQLQDGAANLGYLTVNFQLGKYTPITMMAQNFDTVTAPALPAGWTTTTSGAQSVWVTSTAAKDTAKNAAYSPDPSSIGVNELVSPNITIASTSAQLTFRNNYNLETSFDGGVLEIKIGSGSFTDILTAGGSFVSGGYNYTLSTIFGNPLGGRQAWSGNSGGFITTVVNLPAAAAGQSIQLKWRCGSDDSNNGPGWYLDTISITDGSFSCCNSSAVCLGATGLAEPGRCWQQPDLHPDGHQSWSLGGECDCHGCAACGRYFCFRHAQSGNLRQRERHGDLQPWHFEQQCQRHGGDRGDAEYRRFDHQSGHGRQRCY